MFQQHTTRRHVKTAVKSTRKALNRALDVAEPRLTVAAGELEDLSRDAYKALRRQSIARLGDLRSGYGKLERQVRRQLPAAAKSKRAGKIALIAAGVTALAIGLLRK